MYKIWVDDVRPAPDDSWVCCGSVTEFICIWCNQWDAEDRVELISLDHDAGDNYKDGGDFIEILDWLEEEYNKQVLYYEKYKDGFSLEIARTIKNLKFHIHSANTVGAANMRRIIKRNGWTEVNELERGI